MWIGDGRCHPCLSLRNCQTNLHLQTEIAVTPSAVCIRTANRDKTTKNIFFLSFLPLELLESAMKWKHIPLVCGLYERHCAIFL